MICRKAWALSLEVFCAHTYAASCREFFLQGFDTVLRASTWRRMGYLNSFGSSQNKEPSLKDLHSRFSIFPCELVRCILDLVQYWSEVVGRGSSIAATFYV